jgi:hypothetical protein
MAEKFFRVHDNDQAPAFSAENAWSGLWGSDFAVDGSYSVCAECDGIGTSFGEQCHSCNGTGRDECQYGYSCCWDAQELLTYFAGTAGDAKVVVFEGLRVGTGFDGEPLAVPTGEVHWTTLGQLQTADIAEA